MIVLMLLQMLGLLVLQNAYYHLYTCCKYWKLDGLSCSVIFHSDAASNYYM